MSSTGKSVSAGMLAGAMAGMAGSCVMEQAQALLGRMQDSGGSRDEPATVKAASAITRPMLGRELTQPEKKIGGPVVHYAFGTLNGALYGGLAQVPGIASAGGLLFGTALWLVADEIGVPAMGLSKMPGEYPPSTHVYALASHVVYGVTTDAVRRLILRLALK